MSREVLRDSVVYLPARLIPALVSLISIPIFTRFVPALQYGQYLLVMSTLLLISSLCVSWLVSVVVRFKVVHGVCKLHRVMRRYLLISILLGCFLLGTLWFVYLDGELDDSSFLAAGALWLVGHAAFEYYAGWLRARNMAARYSAFLSWRALAGVLVSIALLYAGYRNALSLIAGSIIAILGALLIMPKAAIGGGEQKPPEAVGEPSTTMLLRYGLPTALINLFTVGISLADRYVIQAYMGASAVAIYGANYDIAEKTVFFANSMLLLSSSVIGFRIFEQEGEHKAIEFLNSLMQLYLRVALPAVLVLAVLSPQFITLLLPAQYHEVGFIFPIVSVAGLLVGIMHRYSLVLSFHRRSVASMWCTGSALLVNLLASIVLVPAYGLLGAAVGTLIASASWLFFIRFTARHHKLPSFPWQTFSRVASTSVFVCACLSILMRVYPEQNLLGITLMLIASATVTLVLYFATKELSIDESKAVIRALRQRLSRKSC